MDKAIKIVKKLFLLVIVLVLAMAVIVTLGASVSWVSGLPLLKSIVGVLVIALVNIGSLVILKEVEV
ncbi:MAG: hypothetical protein SPI72_03380 [Porphyromonas sp.]|nr:hypothetical protein [Porphyromonas sp.]